MWYLGFLMVKRSRCIWYPNSWQPFCQLIFVKANTNLTNDNVSNFEKCGTMFNFGRMLTVFGLLAYYDRVQVNLWGFERVTSNGPEKGAYYHKHFLKGKHAMVKLLTRQRGNKTTDSPVQSPLKSTKPKHSQKMKNPTPSQRHVNKLREDEMKSSCCHGSSANIGCDSNVSVSDKCETSTVELASGHLARNEAVEIVSLDSSNGSQRKLLFEGCEFFPLEEERYDELEEIILQSGTDLLNWSKSYNDSEQSKSPSIPNNLALPPPPSQLCRV